MSRERASIIPRLAYTGIPPRTSLDVLRQRSGLSGLTRIQQSTPVEEDWRRGLDRHVFKQPAEKQTRTITHEGNGKITWETEVHEDYNGRGDLGVVMQLRGLSFNQQVPFQLSREKWGPDCYVLQTNAIFLNKLVALMLETRPDVLTVQVVGKRKHELPSFQETVPFEPRDLLKGYNLASMSAVRNNGLVIVSYNRRN